MSNATPLRWRFNRRGEVIPDERRMSALYNTDAYMKGDRLFAPRRCSPARHKFRGQEVRDVQVR